MSHVCRALLIHCMDFRLVKEIHRYIQEKELLGNCDVVSVAGAGQSILEVESAQVLLKQVAVAVELHKIKTVILLHHSNCGVYKLKYGFTTANEEKNQQLDDMNKIEKIIGNRFPNLTVSKVWAKMLDEDGDRVEFIEM